MHIKTTKLTKEQTIAFNNIHSHLGSCATLPLPGTYLNELVDCRINPRGTISNHLLGCVITKPSGSQLGIETVFEDYKDGHDNGDLHIVNLQSNEIQSHYGGWGTWVAYYGDNHWGKKDYLRQQVINIAFTKKE